MRCPGLSSLLLCMVMATQASAQDYAAPLPGTDLATLQFVQFDADGRLRNTPYRLSLSLVPIRPANAFEPGFATAARAMAIDERPGNWLGRDSRTLWADSEGPSLAPMLRLETKGERLELKPRRHSLSIQWRKAFP